MMNNQKPEAAIENGHVLDLHSIFFTIQGEGPFAGHRSIFVRLAGCNLQCPGCDTEYTEGRQVRSIDSIIHMVASIAAHNNMQTCLVVITGGEPLRQRIGKFVMQLLSRGHMVQIESNGVFAPDEHLQVALSVAHQSCKLIVSPKTRRVNHVAAAAAYAFKYVLDYRSVSDIDGLPLQALGHRADGGVARPPEGKLVYLNPFDAKNDSHNKRNLEAAVASCLKHGHILGVQLHKLINLP